MHQETTTSEEESGGVMPGITSTDVKAKKSKIDVQWHFPHSNPTEEEIREIICRCTEIAVRILFEKFTYNFGGKTYLQSKGGPIGARVTMACARLVMHDWGESFLIILLRADLKITLLKGYVDDVRLACTLLKLGMRYCSKTKTFVHSHEDEMHDKIQEEKGESINARMTRICHPAIEDVNQDLKFTSEIEEDFPDGWMPTLDFKTDMDDKGSINHTYFQKDMKTPFVVMKRSAMASKQKFSILSNELIRRMSNVNREGNNSEEKNRVVEEFIQEMKNSGWGWEETREIVVSGLLGWARKHKRRDDQGLDFYRSAGSTLNLRTRKKLTAKTNWYKPKVVEEEDMEDDLEKRETSSNRDGQRGEKRKRENSESQRNDKKREKAANKPEYKIMAVMNCPATPGGELAKRLRQGEQEMKIPTGYILKIVERAGVKILDQLHKSNPWRGDDCERWRCMHCKTKVKTEKYQTQCCKRRKIIYETWCMSCENKEAEKIRENSENDKEAKEKIDKIQLYKYVGESSRSIFERGWEHEHDKNQLRNKSHMLRHAIEMHGEEKLEEVEFGIRLLRTARTSFERQILESVLIQEHRHHHLLNSKSEYNRCALPRLATKI